MFDIDGTLVDSYELDSECFINAVREVTGVQINSDWSRYHHVTDSGILEEILNSHNIRNKHEVAKCVKQVFLKKLEKSISDEPIQQIPGAASFVSRLSAMSHVVVSLATGGWYESAVLKLKSAGIEFSGIPMSSANHSRSRIEIMKYAAFQVSGNKNIPCTYFGDGSWDKKACEQLGFNIVLVGSKLEHKPAIINFEVQTEALICIGL